MSPNLSQSNSYRAIVLGASGAVGSALVRELLASPACSAVVVLNRRILDIWLESPGKDKLIQHVINLEELEELSFKYAQGCTLAFCTFGAGQPTKLSRDEFWKVDVEYPAAFARACYKAGVQHISLLSSIGADLHSRSHYLKVKGEAEKAMSLPGFARTSLFRPSLLATSEVRYGLIDRLNQAIFPMISGFLPPPLHEIHVEDLGRAMRVNAERSPTGAIEILRYQEFVELAR